MWAAEHEWQDTVISQATSESVLRTLTELHAHNLQITIRREQEKAWEAFESGKNVQLKEGDLERLDIPAEALNAPRESSSQVIRRWQRDVRYSQRHTGKSTVVWGVFKAASASEPGLKSVVWIRHSNGLHERVAVEHPDSAVIHDSGENIVLKAQTQMFFETHVAPRIAPHQRSGALKYGW